MLYFIQHFFVIEILAADKAALGQDFEAFEEQITAAYDKVEEAKNMPEDYARTL